MVGRERPLYLVVVLVTWGLAPLVALLCPRRPDRGATVARPLGLLAVVYPPWLLSSLGIIPYSSAGLWAPLALGSASGWGLALRCRQVTGA